VSTLGLEPELFLAGAPSRAKDPCWGPRFLTTGTFNLVVKDRRRFPPERGVFSPAKSCCTSTYAPAYTESDCPRNLLKLLVLLLSCQSVGATGFPPVFHIGNSTKTVVMGVSRARNRMYLPTRRAGLQRQVRREPVLARAGSEDSWLKKRTF
jgi:hypothetical protein